MGRLAAAWMASLVVSGCYLSHERAPRLDSGIVEAGRPDAGGPDAPRDAGVLDAGPCSRPETCNRIDDDCDGFVDEGPRAVGAAAYVAPLTDYRFSTAAGAYDPDRHRVGVVLGNLIGTTTTFMLYFARLDASTGELVGDFTPIATADGISYGVVYDGRHFTVAMTSARGVELHRVDADTGAVSLAASLDPTGASVSIARLGATERGVVVAWRSPDGVGRLARLVMPVEPGALATPLGPVVDVVPDPTGPVHFAAAVDTAEGALAFFLATRTGMGLYTVYAAPLSDVDVGAFAPLSDVAVTFVVPAREPTTDLVALGVQSVDAAGSLVGRLYTLDASGVSLGPPLSSAAFFGGLGFAGEPGQLETFSGMYVPSTGEISRVRISDRAVVPGAPIALNGWNGAVAVPAGPARQIYFRDDDVDLYAYPVLCAIE